MEPANAERDRRILLKIFPAEIWTHILGDLVSESRSKKGVSDSSFFFRAFLNHNRTKWLFPQVWSMMARHVENTMQDIDKTSEEFKLNLSIIGKCRRVCRQWNSNVDDFIRAVHWHFNLEHVGQPFGFCNVSPLLVALRRTSLFPPKLIDHFRETHDKTARSPFIANSAVVIVQEELPAEPVLEKYGQHIWHCLMLMESSVNIGDLNQALLLMPNLRSLVLNMVGEYSQQDLVRYDYQLKQENLPHLKHLQVISMRSIPDPLASKIVSMNRLSIVHMTKLE